MELNEEQKKQVAAWIASGEGLSAVQTRLVTEFGINMTFMEVRFLVDDLDLEIRDPAPRKEPQPDSASAHHLAPSSEKIERDTTVPSPDASPASDLAGAVTVSVDKLQRPGAVVSGSVTFSDGATAHWQIDQMGRLGIIPSQEGYQPSPDDIAKFQESLQNQLQSQGF